LRELLDRRFDPNEFPADLVTVLMRRCTGRQAAIANQMADLMEAEILEYDDGTWRLPPAGLKDPRLIDAFSRGLFEEVDKPLAALAEEKPELARVLRELLSVAALCGRYIPMAALLEHLQLDKTTAEAAVDWVDEALVGEVGWLTDLGFHVVRFPEHDVYTFTHPLLPRVVLDQESEVAREMRAATLLRFLEQRVPVTRRGWARCFLSIAQHLGDRDRVPYERPWLGGSAWRRPMPCKPRFARKSSARRSIRSSCGGWPTTRRPGQPIGVSRCSKRTRRRRSAKERPQNLFCRSTAWPSSTCCAQRC
jgi:hypothetical protein